MSGVNQSDWERFAWGPPASELPGAKTLVTDKSKKNLPTDIDRTPQQALPPGSATPNQVKPDGGGGSSGGGSAGDGDSARGQETRDIPEAYYNKPDGSKPTMEERNRTKSIPGEQHGNPTKFDYGTPTRRHMEGGDHEAGLKEKFPKKRQRKQKGEDKIKSKRWYQRNRSRHSGRARRRYYRLRNNRAFQRDREMRRKYPERFRRRRASSKREITFVIGPDHRVGWVDTVGADGVVWFTMDTGDQSKLPLMTFLSSTAFVEEEDIEAFFQQVDEHMMTYEGFSPEAVHGAADLWGIPWDNDESFMDRTEELIGKRHLDDMTEEELELVSDAITDGAFDPELQMAKVASEGRSKTAAQDKEALRSYKPTKKRRKKWRGVQRSKGRQYERKRKRSGKRRNYMKRYNRRRNRDPRVKRQRKLRRRQRSRWRKRGKWTRLADVLTAPEINFLYGPGQDDLGVLHAVSTFTGMATIRTTKKDAEPLISVPVPVLLESIVPLTEEDGEALFDLLEAELGQDFYDELEFTLDDLMECAKLYGRNTDSSHFKSKCKDLIGDKSLEEASSDELALVNSVLVTKLEGQGFERGKDTEVFEDEGDELEVDPSDDDIYFGEVDRPPEDLVKEAGEVMLYDQSAPNKEIKGPADENRNYTPTSPTHYRIRPQDKKPGTNDVPDPADYAQRADPPSSRVVPDGQGQFVYYDGHRQADWESFAQREAREFEVEIGQSIWYGKYKNKKGVIRGFKTNDKGDTIIIVDQIPNPTGRKKPKELKLFRVRPRKVDPEGKTGDGGEYMDHPELELDNDPYLDAPLHNVRSAVAEKYEHIDFKPPESVANAAEKGLEYRQKASPSNRGGLTTEEAGKEGIGSGVQRAVNLKNRDDVTPETINKMVGFFARHEKNKGIAEEHKGEPWNDKGYVAWLLWGGDPGKSWANKIKGQMNKADEKAKKQAGFDFDDFDSFGDIGEPEMTPEREALLEFERQAGGPSRTMVLNTDMVRDRKVIQMVDGRFQYIAPHRAWYVYADIPSSKAVRLGRRLFRNLVGRRNVPTHLPALHQVPLWVGSNDGRATRVDPPSKSAASSSQENEPTNPELWEKVQKLTKGEIKSLTHDGETIEGPNDGDGFKVFPSAYANGWAARVYKQLGGSWKKEASAPLTVDEVMAATIAELWDLPMREAKGKAKKDVGKGGLDEWFSGHGDDDGDARWGDWVAISPVEKTLDSGKKVKPGDIVGPCGISDDPDWKEFTNDGEDPLKCMPRNKAHDMPKKERAELAKKKQRAEKKDTSKGKKPTRTETFSKDDDKKKKKADEDGSYMSAQHLRGMAEHAEEMLCMLDEDTPLPDWAESQITWASTSLTGVYEYMFHGSGRDLAASGHWKSPSYMTIQRLWEIKDHATEMLTRVSERTQLPDWAESKISQSAYWVLNVYEYMGHNPRATKTAAKIVDLITRTGPDVYDRAKSIGAASLVRARPDTGMWLFNVKGRTDTYRVRVKGIRKGNVKNLKKADVKVSCSCPFWRWQGPEHWGKKNGYLYGRPRGTATYPKIMDPPGNHWVCKHVLKALRLARNYRFASDAVGLDEWFGGEVEVTPVAAPMEDLYTSSNGADWDALHDPDSQDT